VDPADGLIDRLANYLAPLFVTNTRDLPVARLMAVRTIASYQPETQADFINIARSISSSMSALAALRRAAAEDMPPALQLRYFGSANSLSRSADQSERTMERRRRYQHACTSPVPQTRTGAQCAGTAAVDPGTGDREIQGSGEARFADRGIGDAEIAELEVGEGAIEAAVAEAMLQYTTGCKPASAAGVAAVNELPKADISARRPGGGVPQAASMLRHRIWSVDPRNSLHSTASPGFRTPRPAPRACFAGDDTLRK
jgi:hypothetical protein